MNKLLNPGYYLTVLGWQLCGLNVKKVYQELMEREYCSAEQWEECQNQLFCSFVRHCYENVPYHRQRFKEVKLHPDDIKSVDDIHKIPVLTKEDVRQNTDRMLAKNFPPSKLIEGHTTGSTGKPLTFYGHKQRSEYIVAGMWRLYSRCGWQPGERIASIWGFSDKHLKLPEWKKGLRDFVSGITHLNAWRANEEEFSQWHRLLEKRKPTVLVCYASSGSRFARWLMDNQLTLPSIKGVYCTSEKLYDAQRELLSQALQCQVFDLYGCGEAIHVACSCEKGNMHTNPDMAVIETGQPNQQGRCPIMVTGLRNWAMPFLRYANGDCGRLKEGSCSCGRQSPLMELQVSRLADVFKFSNGKEYPSLYFILRLYRPGFEGVELFQYHQDAIDHIYLRVVKNDKFTDTTQRNLESAAGEIEQHIENQAAVELVYTDYIEQSAIAKHYYAKSDIK